MIYQNILGTIGRTPIVKLNRMAPQGVDIYVKVESFNPMASVKDRLAYAIIKDARDSGELKPGQTVVEATSGNTGIALAMVCAVYGHPFVATMAESFSVERRKLMRAFGAKVILTPAEERGSGMVRLAEELAEKHGWFLARQFENPANPAYHRATTGPEILQDFAGEPPRLLGHRMGHRRYADRGGRGDQAGAARDEDHRRRTRPGVAAHREGMEPAQDPGLDAGLRAGRPEPRRGRRDRARGRDGGARHRAATGARGRHAGGNLRRRDTRSRPGCGRPGGTRKRHAGDAAG